MLRKCLSENEFEFENENDDIFSWVDPILVKKKVRFSKKNTIHIIENRDDHGWNLFNMHMNESHYILILDNFKKERDFFIKCNPFYTKKSNDDLVIQVCEFTEKNILTTKNVSNNENKDNDENKDENETSSQINSS